MSNEDEMYRLAWHARHQAALKLGRNPALALDQSDLDGSEQYRLASGAEDGLALDFSADAFKALATLAHRLGGAPDFEIPERGQFIPAAKVVPLARGLRRAASKFRTAPNGDEGSADALDQMARTIEQGFGLF